MEELHTENLARYKPGPIYDPAPPFLKHLSDEQQKVILASHIDAQITALQAHIETLKTARDMLKVVVVKR